MPFGTVVKRGRHDVEIADGGWSHDGNTWGTYLHGLFANPGFRHRFLKELGWSGAGDFQDADAEYERLADAVEQALDWNAIARLLRL